MRNKLPVNKDYYPTDAHKLAYAETLPEGDAAKHAHPRMKPESQNAFQNVEALFTFNAFTASSPTSNRLP